MEELSFTKLGRDILIQDDSLEDAYCDGFIEVFHRYPKLMQTLNAENGHYPTDTDYDTITIESGVFKSFSDFLINRMKIAVRSYKEIYDIRGDTGRHFSLPELMCFRKDKGQITKHVDSSGSDYNRSLAMIWYLNDVTEGGILHFPSKSLEVKVSPKKGRMVIFPCDWTHYHYVTPVISNDRYSLMTFLEYDKT